MRLFGISGGEKRVKVGRPRFVSWWFVFNVIVIGGIKE
jgi:hypothetical protein